MLIKTIIPNLLSLIKIVTTEITVINTAFNEHFSAMNSCQKMSFISFKLSILTLVFSAENSLIKLFNEMHCFWIEKIFVI